jgi:hypothetical protein
MYRKSAVNLTALFLFLIPLGIGDERSTISDRSAPTVARAQQLLRLLHRKLKANRKSSTPNPEN